MDVEALSVYPHAHYLAKDVRGSAKLPDGTTRWLIWIKDWDFKWQDIYTYTTPMSLPRGTMLTMLYTYDNSQENPHNPHHPPTRVVHGPHSSDEMADLWLQVLPRDPSDIAVLEQDYRARELTFMIAALERTVQTSARDSGARSMLGTRYLQAGRIPDAMSQLEQALRLEPGNAEAHNSLGTALQSQGDLVGAIDHFRRAISSNPRFAIAHNNLGVALVSNGALDEAVQYFRRALVIEPAYGDAHTNLAIALGRQGKIDESILHLRQALDINPADSEAQKGLSLLQRR